MVGNPWPKCQLRAFTTLPGELAVRIVAVPKEAVQKGQGPGNGDAGHILIGQKSVKFMGVFPWFFGSKSLWDIPWWRSKSIEIAGIKMDVHSP